MLALGGATTSPLPQRQMTSLPGRPGDGVWGGGARAPSTLSGWLTCGMEAFFFYAPPPGLGEGRALGGGEAVTPRSWLGKGCFAHSSSGTPKFSSHLRAFADAVPTDRDTPPHLTQEWNTSLGLGDLLGQPFLPE